MSTSVLARTGWTDLFNTKNIGEIQKQCSRFCFRLAMNPKFN